MRGLSVMHTADEPMKRLLSLALLFHFRFQKDNFFFFFFFYSSAKLYSDPRYVS